MAGAFSRHLFYAAAAKNKHGHTGNNSIMAWHGKAAAAVAAASSQQ